MKHISTRGQSPPISFDEIVLSGLAPDGGLYVPEAWPLLTTTELEAMRGQSYADAAAAIVKKFAGPDTQLDIERAVRDAYAEFRHKDVAPVRRIHETMSIVELFHGPTFAFKDFALQVLGRLIAQRLAQTGERRVIVAATSGDTGSAAIAALANQPGVDIVVLHPKGRVSDIQRRQMTTVDAANVHNVALDGSFDDAQALVKAMFNDKAFAAEIPLGAVNSINWARLAIQTVYYVTSSLALQGRNMLHYAVPTGNFGDVFSGYVAKKIGAAIEHFSVSTNENRIVADSINDGVYQRGQVTPTYSPSMDIQVASNFERLLFCASGHDAPLVRDLLEQFDRTGAFTIPQTLHKAIQMDFSALWTSDQETLVTIERFHRMYGEFIDPHTATAVCGMDEHQPLAVAIEYVALATAHPAKFPRAIKAATGREPPLPVEFQQLLNLPEKYTVLPNDLRQVQAFIRARVASK